MLSRRSKALLPEQLDEIDDIIKDYQKSYNSLAQKKENLLNLSAETLSNGPITEYILYLSFYEDEKLERKLFEIDEIIDFDDNEIFETINVYRKCLNLFGTSNMRRLSVSKNIQDYIKNSSNAESYFNRSGYLLTQNQLSLFDYCKYFISLVEKIPNITEEERNDPDEIEKIFITEMNNKNKDKDNKKVDSSSLKKAADSFRSM